jgi:hypothetical protein
MAKKPAPPSVLLPLSLFIDRRRSLDRDAFAASEPSPVLLIPPRLEETNEEGDLVTGAFNSLPRDLAAGRPGQETLVARVVKRSQDAFREFVWVGRSSGCDVPLLYPGVSKLHAQFARRPGGWQLTDVGSKNGTFLQDERITQNKFVDVPDGATVRFGTVLARFLLPGAFADELAALGKERGKP